MKPSTYKKITKLLGSKRFFIGIVGLFILESGWIAVSSRYPTAFDEDFHFGLIQLYAHHLLPFFTYHPAGADAYGAVARDPSYLYHYLMSFIYRLMNACGLNLTAEIIILRLANIALFTWGLFLFRKLLLGTNLSAMIVNLVLLFFVLTPVVPLLAGQINYDNLFIPLVALSLLVTVNFAEKLRQSRFDTLTLIELMTLCLLASIVKYAFLPVFMVILVYISYLVVKFRSAHSKSMLKLVKDDWRSVKISIRALAVAGVILSSVLFAQRYAVNAIKYHNLIPSCDQVLSVQHCSAYGPWARDYFLVHSKIYHPRGIIYFAGDWFYGMFERSFFVVNGPESKYATQPALPVLAWTAVTVGVVGLLFFLIDMKAILRRYPKLNFLFVATIVYSGALWIVNYQGYQRTGQPVAINGRYLFPVAPFIFLVILFGYQKILRNKPKLKLSLLSIVLIIYLSQGAGALTFIIRSDPSWYWPNNRFVDTINRGVRDVVGPIVIH